MSTHDKDNDQGTDLPLDDAEYHNGQQSHREKSKVDDDPNMSVGVTSSDFLVIPERGKGVCRLNRLSLVIVGGAAALAVVSVTYTMYDRQQQQQMAANGTSEARAIGATTESPVQPGPASVPPVPPEMSTDAGQSDTGQQARGGAPVERGGQPQNTNSAPPQVSQAMQDRLQGIKQAEDLCFQLTMQSPNSDSSIETGH